MADKWPICHECKEEVIGPLAFRDIFGSPYHARCYVEAMPPHPGPGRDPEYERALACMEAMK